MKRTLAMLALCIATTGAFAQSPVRQLRANAVATFPNGNELQVISTAPDESFLVITNPVFTQGFATETINESNERMQSVPGIRGFSRGGHGACKLVVETARTEEILRNVIGFSSQEIEKILQ